MGAEHNEAYYQAHKDDDTEWGDAVPAPEDARPTRRLESVVSVRFSPQEVEDLRSAAGERGSSLSAFVREAALRAARIPADLATTVHPTAVDFRSTSLSEAGTSGSDNLLTEWDAGLVTTATVGGHN